MSENRPFDPERVIAPAPGETPWGGEVPGERGVAQGIPLVYGTRHLSGVTGGQSAASFGAVDEVHRTQGDAPRGTQPASRTQPTAPVDRSSFASLERRNRRENLRLLVLFAAITTLSIVGLWWVATVVFG